MSPSFRIWVESRRGSPTSPGGSSVAVRRSALAWVSPEQRRVRAKTSLRARGRWGRSRRRGRSR
eukprot:10687602-Alexandrium_andersonii.AAC.1